MSVLKNRIDFVVFAAVKYANPNGDPLMGNMPRMDRRGHGIMSNVCIKRKMRNRMQDLGYGIAIKTNDRADDGYHSIKSRVEGTIGKPGKDESSYKKSVCDAFADYRTFGAILPWKGGKSGDGVSVAVTGAVTIQDARSVDPIIIESMQIVKSTNSEDSEKRGPDTMGMRHVVEFGLYRIEGSISVAAAERIGMQEEDAALIKETLRTLFLNDESAARPSGSMWVAKMFWCEHACAIGNCDSRKVFDAIHADLKNSDEQPESVGCYDIYMDDIPGLHVEVFE